MGLNQFEHRIDIVKHLKKVATEVQGDLKLYNQQIGELRQGMVHLRNNDIYVAKGDVENAAIESRESLKFLPGCIEAMRAAADSHFCIEEYKQAIHYYSDLIKLYPDSKDIHYQIGRSCSELKDYENSIRAFEQEITISGDAPDIHLQLGWAYQALGDQIYESLNKNTPPNSNELRTDCRSKYSKAKDHYQQSVGAAEKINIDTLVQNIDQRMRSL